MEVSFPQRLEVAEQSQIGEVRRRACRIATQMAFNEADVGRVAIAANEVASNIIKHGRGGEVLLQPGQNGRARSLTIIALDHGPGIPDVAVSLSDGVSTAGTPGTGFGAIARQSDEFCVYSTPGHGAAVVSRIWPGDASPTDGGILAEGVLVPHPREELCGDGWATAEGSGRRRILVVDGLGHGPQAFEAARAAIECFRSLGERSPAETISEIHGALRPTRGAAAAVAEIDEREQVVRYCGVGNVAGATIHGGASHNLVSHYGTLGHDVRKIHEFQYAWEPGALLLLHSDGIQSNVGFNADARLSHSHPLLIAAMLYRDFRRGNDDATVVVAKRRADA
jgi:anti-sigma regulatory factor (Ser/Thr protein kinase)